MSVNKVILAFTVIIIIFGTIALSSALGLWNTESTKVPVKYKDGEYAGQYNPADIRGSYSFGNISELFNIPIEDLSESFAIPNGEPRADFLCKYLEEMYVDLADQGKEVGTDSVRIFVALYTGLPIALNEGTYFPETAEAILMNTGNLTEEQKEYLQNHLVPPVINRVEHAEDEGAKENIIKGQTTFKEAINMGVTQAELEKIVDGKITNLTQTIRDYCVANELQFSSIKTQIQAKIK